MPNLGQTRIFQKKSALSLLSVYECLTSCQKSEKTNEQNFRYWGERSVDQNWPKMTNLEQTRIIEKNPTLSLLSVYECQNSCQKSGKINEQIFRYWGEHWFVDQKCPKMTNLGQTRIIKKNPALSLLKVYEFLTS